ncbi:hypothetical protein GCM10010211_00750 [Streptomyces albospinus]|uniref:Uncharacterized protein n=1 Tax=Streptomyces albospinus TaxID=285515 RepID=A0ABQ2UJX5_9ACTN|nr:hypothetical protein [Streptomyces albospinus]GGU41608.1 hypothetical protein GCM10010211_00750 [Streptomyces albospinus]
MTNAKTPEAEKAVRKVVNRRIREGSMRRSEANRLVRDGLPIILSGFAEARIKGKPEAAITADLEAALAEAKQRQATARTATRRRMALLDVSTAEFAIAAWEGVRRDLAAHLASNS